MSSLRIVVADDEPDMRKYFSKCLPRLGHQVIGVAENGRELVEKCRALQPDLVISDIKMPQMDGIEAAVQIYRERPVPVILVSAHHDAELIARAEADHILGYLVKPIKQADLEPTIAMAVRRFRQFEALRKETTDLRQALQDRKVMERAMGILMRRGQLDEEAAFKQLQTLAMGKGSRLSDTARTIVEAEDSTREPINGLEGKK